MHQNNICGRVTSVALRIMEFISACIVLGITSRFIYLVDQGHGRTNSRLIYTEAIAAISLTFSILLSPPFYYSFWAFPLDLALFICWMVAFGILDNLTGSGACSSTWYWNYWGFYWGQFWRVPGPVTPAAVGNIGCSYWRSTLAWSFLGGFFWLFSSILGLIMILKRRQDREDTRIPETVAVQNNGPLATPTVAP